MTKVSLYNLEVFTKYNKNKFEMHTPINRKG